MKVIFFKELKRTRTSMIIWGLFVGLIAYMGILEYPVIGQYTAVIGDTLALIPPIAQMLFGVYNINIAQPIGYYIVMYYWAGLLVFTHAIYMGASIVAKEKRDKTAEFLFTKPEKRRTIVVAKLLAGLVNIAVVGLVAIAMSLIAMQPITTDSAVSAQILLSGVGMFATQCVLLAVGFWVSSLFKTYKSGMFASVAFLILSYCLLFFVQSVGLSSLNFVSPLAYFNVSEVVAGGINVFYVLLSIAVIAVCVYFGVRIYGKKEMV